MSNLPVSMRVFPSGIVVGTVSNVVRGGFWARRGLWSSRMGGRRAGVSLLVCVAGGW